MKERTQSLSMIPKPVHCTCVLTYLTYDSYLKDNIQYRTNYSEAALNCCSYKEVF